MLATPTRMLATLLTTAALVGAASSTASAEPTRKPEHHAKFDVKRLDATHYLFFGKVSTYPHGRITVLRDRVGRGGYAPYRRVTLHNDGTFSTRLSGRQGDCFRMRIPQANGYRTTVADLGCIVPR